MTAPKPRKEMLSKSYKAPKTEKGSHVELEGGRLVSSPTFTTSASKQEANADKRKATGSHFGDRVHTVTSVPSTETDTGRPLQAAPVSYKPANIYSNFTDEQKLLYNQELKDNAPVVIDLSARQKKMTRGKK